MAASGGNHGAAVAYAAQKLGYPARIFVPAIATPAKIDHIRSYGAEVIVGGERYVDALRRQPRMDRGPRRADRPCLRPVRDPGRAGDHGAGMLEQAPDLDTVLIAVGGGGLIGGIAAAYAGDVKVVGVEPENAARPSHGALDAGDRSTCPVGGDRRRQPRRPPHRRALLRARAVHRRVGAGHGRRHRRRAEGALGRAADRGRTRRRGGDRGAAVGRLRAGPGERVGVMLCGANTTRSTSASPP